MRHGSCTPPLFTVQSKLLFSDPSIFEIEIKAQYRFLHSTTLWRNDSLHKKQSLGLKDKTRRLKRQNKTKRKEWRFRKQSCTRCIVKDANGRSEINSIYMHCCTCPIFRHVMWNHIREVWVPLVNRKADGNAKKNRKTNQKKHRDCDLYIVYTYTLHFLLSWLFGEGLCTLHICQTRDHAADKRLHLLAMSHPRWSLKSWKFKGAPPMPPPPKKLGLNNASIGDDGGY